ncbi:MAG: ATP-binding cassette domain-containing protein [Kurthia gibsonii]|uniref:ABC transporter ATP-binding protein n=1 Tax=Kurthia gibsonii TaxID=33946 RepID=A0ABU9LQH4_9BACL|nr:MULTISPECIES: ABC transporter ATP-binding protein [Kurthia]MCA9724438.1 ABC transporter ATP-binding protein [Kurthia sp.]AMA63192.1 ABC transporter family protein [Kurthia sp. 11kri321]MEB6112075.1 ABC transporter ATP-binding protein [Kurthia gibsonii]MEB7771240.1 ABC transporter ATP-binding protein [Kurthia gibsonii]RXH53357.1 ABC transporter ATP-binding protein [Kurthia gibsonii]
MINVKKVCYKHRNRPVLNDVSFQIPIGKVIGIAGENGAGKSTLLRLLAGIKNPDDGTITLDHQPLTHRTCSRFAYLPDTDDFYSYLTGVQLFQFYETQFEDFNFLKALEVADFLDINIEQKIKTLSKGQRGRLKMAATLGRETTYYFMDEPFSGLDPMVRDSLIKGLIRFTDAETQTIVLSTHELYEVEPILDALLLLKNGEVISYHSLETIREEWQQDAVSWMKKQYRKE